MLILIAGLPRAGKSSFADAVETLSNDYTHVPLDKYIREVPVGQSFLDWVSTPDCIDWALLQQHLQRLADNHECYTPHPDWNNGARRISVGGTEPGGRLMKPARQGYLLPGTYAFHYPFPPASVYRVFMDTPPAKLAERLIGQTVAATDIARILDQHYSKNWRELEARRNEADLVLSGVETRTIQLQVFLNAVSGLRPPA